MILTDDQVATTDVKAWKGLHLLHFSGSSCSQKVRILLREKQLPFVSHHINLARNEHVTPWFLGINPRGVVPVLVHDGVVHLESNDIMAYLDGLPSGIGQSYFPQTDQEREAAAQSLKLEDDLHVDLRNLTMGFIFPRRLTQKSEDTLRRYEADGANDPKRMKEVKWWRDFAREGVTKEAARGSVAAFRDAFTALDARLASKPWLIGDRLSIVDIAWFISAHRLKLAGYRLAPHPHLQAWYERLSQRPAFAREIQQPAAVSAITTGYRLYRRLNGTTLNDIAA
ncbi:MAG: glutathione S-transferase family protein [Alphaproteobacteria bacterium]|nr:glutathione S-transferase family protein [Alphaproteobacteria bacterium]